MYMYIHETPQILAYLRANIAGADMKSYLDFKHIKGTCINIEWNLYLVALFPVIYGNENVRCYAI